MATLEENRNLMQRISNLPTNDEELHKLGFSDNDISTIKDTIMLVDPEANRVTKRMQEILHYLDNMDKDKAADPLRVTNR